jgi:dipeptidyl aminopeptidase/acylaminoacyl peptidase
MFRALAVLSCLCLCLSTRLWAAPPPVAAFGRTPAIESVALSPSGNLVAWVSNEGTDPLIHIFDLTKAATRNRFAPPPDVKLRGLSWFNDETLFIHGSVAGRPGGLRGVTYEWYRTLALDIATGKSRMLLHVGGLTTLVTGSDLLSMRTPEPNKVIMASWNFSAANYRETTGSRLTGGRKDEGWTYDVYKVDTQSGEPHLVRGGTPFTREWAVDATGEPIARTEWHADRSQFTLMYGRGTTWNKIFATNSGEAPDLLGLASDGSGILIRGTLNRPHVAIWRVPLDGAAPVVVVGDDNSDIAALIRDPYSDAILGAWSSGTEPKVFWLDDKARARAEGLNKTFGGKPADLIGRSADGTRALVAVGTHATPDTFYLIDYKKGTADIVGEEYPALEKVPLGEVREFTYKARDGYDVPAFLTLPPGIGGKQLPLVVLPHGGPESRDTRDFDWLAQFLASRGYAVLQPQFRGSTGYGEAHRKAGYRQWGALMQDDVSDGVKALIEQGIADSARVCIAGASYGGYAALAGSVFTPDLYACAISINGVSDLPAMLGFQKTRGGEESDSLAYWKEHIGPVTDPALAAKSPARVAVRVRAPILLLHGVDDSVVPVDQSRNMAKALKTANKPHTFIELPGEDHWLSRSTSRIRVLTEMEKFLAEHLQPNR